MAWALVLCGCVTDGSAVDTQEGVPPITTETVQENANVQYYPSDEPLRLGIENFNRGNFGVAERYFQDATEKAPKDASAWIGLAASYDRLGRFDLADRAYESAIRLVGETTAILNNRGYSYMLRGDLVSARRVCSSKPTSGSLAIRPLPTISSCSTRASALLPVRRTLFRALCFAFTDKAGQNPC